MKKYNIGKYMIYIYLIYIYTEMYFGRQIPFAFRILIPNLITFTTIAFSENIYVLRKNYINLIALSLVFVMYVNSIVILFPKENYFNHINLSFLIILIIIIFKPKVNNLIE